MSALDHVLQHPAVWRGSQYAKVTVESVPTGFAELDGLLPGGGWPRAALTELLIAQSGIGELRLLAPALARMSRQEKWLALVAPPYLPYAPAFDALGIDLSRLIVVESRSDAQTLWAAERCLRSGACSAVIAWPGAVAERALRRLQSAAEQGKSLGVLFSPLRCAAQPSPAPLRIQLACGRSRLTLHILKRRGGGWAAPLTLDVGFGQPLTATQTDITQENITQRNITVQRISAAPARSRRIRQGIA
ncbi:MAG: translesion DNA synthesis-associated protein ImuA [Burkholderiales bacterium]|nr:translesion DNA synthesis-associated protein ImuA [Burkholderiales bacterium]